jgi:hypothetical protein
MDFTRIMLCDGKNFTLLGVLVNYYATAPAPATTVELIKDLNDK